MVEWPGALRDIRARGQAIGQYRGAAAFHRALGEEIEAGCDHRGGCAHRCAQAAHHRRVARRLEVQAWLEEHNP